MFQHMASVLRKQKRLLLIFSLTIFLPSVTLSVFGLIALRNERYRLERQFREEQYTLIDTIKSQVEQQISSLEHELFSLVRTPSFRNRNDIQMLDQVEQFQDQHPLSDQFFVVYDGYEPWFLPFCGPGSGYHPAPKVNFSDHQQSILKEATNFEFVQHDSRGALLLLQELQMTAAGPDLQAQVLNIIGRNHMKLQAFDRAIQTYTRIINQLPVTRTSSGTFLPVTVRFQLADCYLDTGAPKEAFKAILEAYQEVIDDHLLLSEDQLRAYSSIAQEKFNSLRQEHTSLFTADTTYSDIFKNLNQQYIRLITRWQMITRLKHECIPEINDAWGRSGASNENVRRYLNRVDNEDFLIIYCHIPGPYEKVSEGIAGIKLNNTFLEDSLFTGILNHLHKDLDASLYVTNLSGRLIYGNGKKETNTMEISSFFESNFPPWQIEMSGHRSASFIRKGILHTYHFWTILVMVMILGFGVAITGRIIAHEKEVLRIKSDFISSISHEFKTPITSIAALTERLLEGSVKDPRRRKEYYTRIAQDTGNLGHLVENILDFSKMEEGMKLYNFEETYLEDWLKEAVKDYFNKYPERKFNLQIHAGKSTDSLKLDRGAMLLAIHNLLDNARKFSSAQTEITVTLEHSSGEYRIGISDEGIGIPPEEQDRIFEKFYRGIDATTYAPTGTGLGLAIIKQIVTAHEGKLQVESSPGHGSTFKMTLPSNRSTST